MEEYGLKAPAVTVTANLDDDIEKTVFLGNKIPGGIVYYMMVKGDSKVYTLAAEEGKHFEYALNDIRDKSLTKLGAQEQVLTAYNIDGKAVSEEDFNDFYSSFASLSVDTECDRQVAAKPEVVVTYYLNKGPERQVTINFCPYNDDFYTVYRDGKADFIIAKSKVKSVLDSMIKIVK